MTNEQTADLALEAGRAKLARDVAAVANEASELLKEYSGSKLRAARQALGQAGASVADGATGVASEASSYVRAHPLQAIAAVGVLGVVLGMLLARR